MVATRKFVTSIPSLLGAVFIKSTPIALTCCLFGRKIFRKESAFLCYHNKTFHNQII